MRFPPATQRNHSTTDASRAVAVRPRPESTTGDALKIAWGVFILPFMEQNNLETSFKTGTANWQDDWTLAVNANGARVATAVIPGFICPSDNSRDGDRNRCYTPDEPRSVGENFGKANYIAIAGSTSSFNNCSRAEFSAIWGILGQNSRTSFGNISDGSSNTALLGERSSISYPEIDPTGTAVTPRANYGAVWSGRDGSNSDYTSTIAGITSFSADYAMAGVTSDNAANWSINGFDAPRGVGASFHPGTSNFVFADGSSHAISENLNIIALMDLCAMADGNIVPGF
jgi:prepilin-type processing-associated H-X9-DG protein